MTAYGSSIYIRTSEIFPSTTFVKKALSQYDTIAASIGGCLTRAEADLTRTRFSSRPESPQGLAPLAGEVVRTKMEERDL